VLGTFSRPDLENELTDCTLTNAGTSALAGVLGRNQGPTRLASCDLDYSVLVNGLRGKSRLKSLSVYASRERVVANQDILAFTSALEKKNGLVILHLRDGYRMSDDTWYAVCGYLKAHPTLDILNVEQLSDSFTMCSIGPSSAHVVDTGTRRHAESEHGVTPNNFA
jgi:hypothetical protein